MSKRTEIQDAIREEIKSGKYTDGERLPGVAEVCERFDVSTATAVYAMRALADEGYVSARHGDGYYAITDETAEEELVDTLRSALNAARRGIDTAAHVLERLEAQRA